MQIDFLSAYQKRHVGPCHDSTGDNQTWYCPIVMSTLGIFKPGIAPCQDDSPILPNDVT
jgi:hypothetical protein